MCRQSYLQFPGGLSASSVLAWCKVLPEQGVIDVSTTVEVDQWLQGNLGGNILLFLCRGDLFGGSVEAVDVGLVVVLVVKLHDLARDGRLQRPVIIWGDINTQSYQNWPYLHGRSGSVALPRTKLVLAIEAARFEALARRAERAAPGVRKIFPSIVCDV